jgi:signal transduction histidine kinase
MSLRGPSLRALLIAVNGLVLLVPVFTLLFLRLYDALVVRQTEQVLINESVLIGEAWRDRLFEAMGVPPDHPPSALPPHAREGDWLPIESALDLDADVLPPQPAPTRFAEPSDAPAWRAGEQVTSLLQRAQRTNLSAVRILDERGCVVATTRSELGACIDELPEVRGALDGRYTAVTRRRISDEPPAPYSSLSRAGDIRVYTALPIFADGRVVGVVRASRTSLSIGKVLWTHRNRLLLAALLSALATLPLSFFLSRAISRPMERLSAAAEAVARGEPRARLTVSGVAPAEVRVMSEALDRMARQLTDRAAYIAEFAATVSHELKTPIAGIRGAAELLAEQWSQMSDAQRARFLANVDADAARMERLATRLLELARIESAPESSRVIELRPFVADVLARYGDAVRCEAGDAPATVAIEPEHLESALRNLVENALRHGAGRPVEVRLGSRGGRAEIAVRDEGPGVRAEIRGRIFDRFFTTERDHGGTGLGLAIAKAVAERRGGTLDFETGAGGTTFRLLL